MTKRYHVLITTCLLWLIWSILINGYWKSSTNNNAYQGDTKIVFWNTRQSLPETNNFCRSSEEGASRIFNNSKLLWGRQDSMKCWNCSMSKLVIVSEIFSGQKSHSNLSQIDVCSLSTTSYKRGLETLCTREQTLGKRLYSEGYSAQNDSMWCVECTEFVTETTVLAIKQFCWFLCRIVIQNEGRQWEKRMTLITKISSGLKCQVIL